MFDLDQGLLDRVYDTVVDPDAWPEVLTRLADLSGSLGGVIYGLNYRNPSMAFRYLGRLDPEASTRYEQLHHRNAWAEGMKRRAVGELVRSEEIIPLDALKRQAFHADVLHPQGIGHSVMAPLSSDGDFRFAFNICQAERSGPFAEDHLRHLGLVMPHLCRAVELRHRFEAHLRVAALTSEALDYLPFGLVLVDRRLRVVFANRPALAFPNGRVRVAQAGLELADTDAQARLNGLLAGLATGGSGGCVDVLDGESRLLLYVAPLRGRLRETVDQQRRGDAAAAVFLAVSPFGQTLRTDLLRAVFGLTPTEANAAAALIEGDNLSVVAKRLGMRVNTLKTHTKRIFDKTGTRRRAELATLLSTPVLNLREACATA